MNYEHYLERCTRLSKILWYSAGRERIIQELTSAGNDLTYNEERLLREAKDKEVQYRRNLMRRKVIIGGKSQ